MITATTQNLTDKLTSAERSQLERREMAVGSWKQGNLENASILLDSVLSERMTPRVAVQCLVSQAAFRAEAQDYAASLASLEKAGEFLEAADVRIRGAFYNQRARAHKELGNIDAALMDYAGASACFEAAGDRDYEGAAVLNVAGLYLKIGDVAYAKTKIDIAITILAECDSNYLPQAYDTLAQIELASGQIENSILAIRQALESVGENEVWRKSFLHTKAEIDKKIQELSGTLHGVNVDIVRRALEKTGGNLTQAGKLTGLSHKGVSYIIDRHPELEAFRVKRRTRTKFKSIIKR